MINVDPITVCGRRGRLGVLIQIQDNVMSINRFDGEYISTSNPESIHRVFSAEPSQWSGLQLATALNVTTADKAKPIRGKHQKAQRVSCLLDVLR